MTEELLAQAVEEVSILAAKKYAREKPRKVERPKWVQGLADGSAAPVDRSGNPFTRAIDRMLAFGASPRAGGDPG